MSLSLRIKVILHDLKICKQWFSYCPKTVLNWQLWGISDIIFLMAGVLASLHCVFWCVLWKYLVLYLVSLPFFSITIPAKTFTFILGDTQSWVQYHVLLVWAPVFGRWQNCSEPIDLRGWVSTSSFEYGITKWSTYFTTFRRKLRITFV